MLIFNKYALNVLCNGGRLQHDFIHRKLNIDCSDLTVKTQDPKK